MKLDGSKIVINNPPADANEYKFTAIGLINGEWYKLNTGPVTFKAAVDNACIQAMLRHCETEVCYWSAPYRQLP